MLTKLIYFAICTIGILSVLFILTSINPIARLVLLIIIFIMSAFIYTLLDNYFLGLTYIIVYVGALAILFIFVIMMCEAKETPKSIQTPIIGRSNNSLNQLIMDDQLLIIRFKSALVNNNLIPFGEASLIVDSTQLSKDNLEDQKVISFEQIISATLWFMVFCF